MNNDANTKTEHLRILFVLRQGDIGDGIQLVAVWSV